MKYDPGALPNLVIIGAMKAGTTSLHKLLKQHPQIQMADGKELNFFTTEHRSSKWHAGLDWYRRCFDPVAPIRGEATPLYAMRHLSPETAGRMASVLQDDARILYMVRDPISRMISHWIHNRAIERVAVPIDSALLRPDNHRLKTSSYHYQLEPYFEHFGRDRVEIRVFEDFVSDPERFLEELYGWLGVDPTFRNLQPSKAQNTSKQKRQLTAIGGRLLPRLPKRLSRRLIKNPLFGTPIEKPVLRDETRRELERRLSEDVAALRETTGLAFERWSL